MLRVAQFKKHQIFLKNLYLPPPSFFYTTINMKWRVYILLIAGLGMIYFAGLALYDVPYPSPVGIQFTESRKLEKNLPDQVILASTEEYIYKTQFVYEEKPNNKKYYYDISSSKIGFYGNGNKQVCYNQLMLIFMKATLFKHENSNRIC